MTHNQKRKYFKTRDIISLDKAEMEVQKPIQGQITYLGIFT